MDFDLASAEWRKGCSDTISMVEALASRLQKALPQLVIVERKFSFFSKNRKLKKLIIRFKREHFFLSSDPSFGIKTTVGQVTNNICLSREECEFNQWMQCLSEAINLHMQINVNNRDAIENFLMN